MSSAYRRKRLNDSSEKASVAGLRRPVALGGSSASGMAGAADCDVRPVLLGSHASCVRRSGPSKNHLALLQSARDIITDRLFRMYFQKLGGVVMAPCLFVRA